MFWTERVDSSSDGKPDESPCGCPVWHLPRGKTRRQIRHSNDRESPGSGEKTTKKCPEPSTYRLCSGMIVARRGPTCCGSEKNRRLHDSRIAWLETTWNQPTGCPHRSWQASEPASDSWMQHDSRTLRHVRVVFDFGSIAPPGRTPVSFMFPSVASSGRPGPRMRSLGTPKRHSRPRLWLSTFEGDRCALRSLVNRVWARD